MVRALGVLAGLVTAVLPALTSALAAGPSAIEPHEVALTLADLPPGFAARADRAGYEATTIAPGVAYRVTFQRELTTDNLRSGPVFVAQFIVRYDDPGALPGLLDRLRDRALQEEGYELAPGAPNDPRILALVKRVEGLAFYRVGFLRGDMAILTTGAGLEDVLTLEGVATLAGVSARRYDAASAPPAAPPGPRSPPTAGVEPRDPIRTGRAGVVVHADPRCDYFLVNAPLGYALLQWYGGATPSEGDTLVGDIESYGFKDLYNRQTGSTVRVWVDDYWMSGDRARERYLDRCGWRLR